MGLVISILLLLIYAVLVGMTIVYISAIVGTVLMLLVPLIGVLTMPERMAEFLSVELFSIMDGAISMRNIHILLAIWTAFLSIVLYTEFLSWYMARIRVENNGNEFSETNMEFPHDEHFEVELRIDDETIEVGKPLICRICVGSELFKAVLIRLEVRVDGLLVDSIEDKWIKCDEEHVIELNRPEVAGEGEITLLTSPPGFNSRSNWGETFLVKDGEEVIDKDATEPSPATEEPGGFSEDFSEEDLDAIREIKGMVDEWQSWKGEAPSADIEFIHAQPNRALSNLDIYQDLLKIVEKYMNEGDLFLEQQIKHHLGATPDTIAIDNLNYLADYIERSATLLFGKEKANALKNDILNLRSSYLPTSSKEPSDDKRNDL